MSEPSILDRLEHADRPPPQPGQGPRRGIIASIVATASILAVKAKAFALILLKFGATGWTMLLSVWAYSMSFGWSFAALLVGLILVHELGHGAAAKLMGVRVGAPVFVPFLGAFIALKDRPTSRWQSFVISAGGPLVGGVASLLCLGIALLLDGEPRRFLTGAGFFGVVMNLFNLMPVWILDGAKIVPAMGAVEGIVGLVLATATLVATALLGKLNAVGAIVLAVAAFQIVKAARGARRREPQTLLEQLEPVAPAASLPAEAPPRRRIAAVVYFGMMVVYVGVTQLANLSLAKP